MKEFAAGDAVEVFTSPGIWMPVTVYAVDGEFLEVGNGDPIYGGDAGNEILETFRVHWSDARYAWEPETGDVVAVLSADGAVAYYGEVASLHPGRWSAEEIRGKVGILNPETGEEHLVAYANGEGFREATEAESDAYIERWVD